jgi:flagellar biosynthetic protein FlhB
VEERNLPASARRRDKFRSQGDIAKSRDLGGAAMVLAGAGVASLAGKSVAESVTGLCRLTFGELDHLQPNAAVLAAGRVFVTAAGPFLLAAMAAAIAVGLAQTRGAIADEAAGFDLGRLNPLPRLQQMLGSKDAAVNLVTSLLKVTAVGWVIWSLLRSRGLALLSHAPSSLAGSLHDAADLLSTLLLRVGLVMLALGLGDYGLSWYRLEVKMRMTFDEAREEQKEELGNPQVRARRRRRMREVLRQRSLRDLHKADVVVTNPTHFSVALAYKSGKMGAPRVIAKGAGPFALRIRELARKKGVPVVAEPPLARALFARVGVGKEVPQELYKAVAVVLAHVYRMRRRAA